MTDPDVVRAELTRLAHDHPPERARERILRRAVEAAGEVEEAAVFVAAGGRERLRTAVEADEAEGDADRAARGRTVLAALERFERACERR